MRQGSTAVAAAAAAAVIISATTVASVAPIRFVSSSSPRSSPSKVAWGGAARRRRRRSTAATTTAAANIITRRRFSSSASFRMAAFAGGGDPRYFSSEVMKSQNGGAPIQVPNFELVFDDIFKVSPLAKQAFYDEIPGGFDAIGKEDDFHKWKLTDNTPKRIVTRIEKIDNYQNRGVPIVRLRSKLHGPTLKRAEAFADLLQNFDVRKKWDSATADVYQIVAANDLNEVRRVQDEHLSLGQSGLSSYGEPSLFGVGYTRTKQSVVSPREQLTLCGQQVFPSGASIIWGVELPVDQDHFFPKGKATLKRSTTHLFSATIVPCVGEEDAFLVEYVLQLDVGDFPGFLTAPVLSETLKSMFRYADKYFRSGLEEGGELAVRLAAMVQEDEGGEMKEMTLDEHHGLLDEFNMALLMPP